VPSTYMLKIFDIPLLTCSLTSPARRDLSIQEKLWNQEIPIDILNRKLFEGCVDQVLRNVPFQRFGCCYRTCSKLGCFYPHHLEWLSRSGLNTQLLFWNLSLNININIYLKYIVMFERMEFRAYQIHWHFLGQELEAKVPDKEWIGSNK